MRLKWIGLNSRKKNHRTTSYSAHLCLLSFEIFHWNSSVNFGCCWSSVGFFSLKIPNVLTEFGSSFLLLCDTQLHFNIYSVFCFLNTKFSFFFSLRFLSLSLCLCSSITPSLYNMHTRRPYTAHIIHAITTTFTKQFFLYLGSNKPTHPPIFIYESIGRGNLAIRASCLFIGLVHIICNGPFLTIRME